MKKSNPLLQRYEEMSCPCFSINRFQMEENMKNVVRFESGYPKRIEARNKCCQSLFDFQYELSVRRNEEILSEKELYTGQEHLSL